MPKDGKKVNDTKINDIMSSVLSKYKVAATPAAVAVPKVTEEIE